MLIISILLFATGAFGIYSGMNAYGDIGIACIIGGVAAVLSGIGFLVARHNIK